MLHLFTARLTERRNKFHCLAVVYITMIFLNRRLRRITALCVVMAIALTTSVVMAFSPDRYAAKSVLAEGRWVKVAVKESGIHFISASDLHKMGFADPEEVAIYGYGGRRLPEVLDAATFIDDLPQVQSLVDKTGLYFYAVGPQERDEDINGLVTMKPNPFSTQGYYFLTDSNNDSRRKIALDGTPGAEAPALSFVDCIMHEIDAVSPGATGHYLVGEDMRFTPSRRLSMELPGAVGGGMLRAGVAMCTDLTSAAAWTMEVDGTKVTVPVVATPSGSEYHGVATEGWTPDINHNGSGKVDISVTLAASSGNARGAWLDWVAVNYDRHLSLADAAALQFVTGAEQVALTGASSSTVIWDVTDALDIKQMEISLEADTAAFTASATGKRVYAAFTPGKPSGLPSPTIVGEVHNQNLHGIPPADMVIFTTSSLRQAALKLASHRREFSGLTVEVVTQDEVFNEFSSGTRDVNAFRKMLKMMHDRDAASPMYVLMMGRGSYDCRRLTKSVAALPYETMPLWSTDHGLNDNQSFTSDDVLVMLADGSGEDYSSDTLSMAIGRLPATSLDEAMTMVDKIISYETASPAGQWRQRTVVIADDDDDCLHMRQAETFCEWLASGSSGAQMLVDKIYIDAYPLSAGEATEARSEFYHALDEGVAWVSYLGHASTTALGGEGIMKYSDIGALYLRHQPFIYAATCNFMRWDADAVSGAEMLAATRGGGVIGTISATRPVYIVQNGRLSTLIAEELGSISDGTKVKTVGEILRRAKNRLAGDANKLRFALLGDPAMRLPLATERVVVDSISGMVADDDKDPIVIQARQEVIVKGHIENFAGEPLPSFTGQLSATLYDADESVVTEGRGGTPFAFDRHGLRLAAARDSVNDGRFSITLAMPPSVTDNYREASLLLTADDDAAGDMAAANFRDFYVLGTDGSAELDTIPPVIKSVYLNHPAFSNGGTVDRSPMLVAEIADDRAINLSLAGVGQSMTISIDGGAIVCADVSSFYEPSGTASGTIAYRLPELTDGAHTLTLRIWDTGGNSTSATVDFFVDSSSKLTVYDIYTSATPASSTARFYLVHDRPDATLRVTVAVYDLWGRPVWINTSIGRSDMYTSSPVEWNLNDMGGARVQRGIYIYRAWVAEYGGTTGSGIEIATPARKMAVAAN